MSKHACECVELVLHKSADPHQKPFLFHHPPRSEKHFNQKAIQHPTTGLAASKHDRHFVGIDEKEEYLDLSINRFEAYRPNSTDS